MKIMGVTQRYLILLLLLIYVNDLPCTITSIVLSFGKNTITTKQHFSAVIFKYLILNIEFLYLHPNILILVIYLNILYLKLSSYIFNKWLISAVLFKYFIPNNQFLYLQQLNYYCSIINILYRTMSSYIYNK